MRLAPWIFVALAAFGLYRCYHSRDIERAPGVLAAADPLQAIIDTADGIELEGFRLMPRADFSATVRVLHREDYSLGALARLVPTDFAVGWGPMSDSTVLAAIEISQGNRFYYWRTKSWPIERPSAKSPLSNASLRASNSCQRLAMNHGIASRTMAGG